ncbi:hypothetical protein BGW42_004844 [Actinomortierella wolfii]|nr:hypothetical protein BGW42_004844 [Actinomortierella wolfii]
MPPKKSVDVHPLVSTRATRSSTRIAAAIAATAAKAATAAAAASQLPPSPTICHDESSHTLMHPSSDYPSPPSSTPVEVVPATNSRSTRAKGRSPSKTQKKNKTATVEKDTEEHQLLTPPDSLDMAPQYTTVEDVPTTRRRSTRVQRSGKALATSMVAGKTDGTATSSSTQQSKKTRKAPLKQEKPETAITKKSASQSSDDETTPLSTAKDAKEEAADGTPAKKTGRKRASKEDSGSHKSQQKAKRRRTSKKDHDISEEAPGADNSDSRRNKNDAKGKGKTVQKDGKDEKEKNQSTELQHNMPADHILNLPDELWLEVFSYLYPSELVKFSQCSKRIHAYVRQQPIWRKIAQVAELPPRKKNFAGLYEIVLYYSEVICEQCFSFSKPKPSHGSDRPLVVQVHWNKHGHQTRLCRLCRADYFEEHPQYDVKDPNLYHFDYLQITKSDVLSAYRLSSEDTNRLPHETKRNPRGRNFAPMRLYNMNTVQGFARRYHGGFLGLVEAKKPFLWPRYKMIEARAKKVNTNEEEKDGVEGENNNGEGSSQVDRESLRGLTITGEPKKPRPKKPRKQRVYPAYPTYANCDYWEPSYSYGYSRSPSPPFGTPREPSPSSFFDYDEYCDYLYNRMAPY